MHPQLLATEGMRLCVRAKVYGIHLCVSLPSELQFSHHAFQAVSLLRSFLLQVAHHLCVHACLRFHTLGDARASSHVCTHSLSHGHAHTEQPRLLHLLAVCCISSSLLELYGATSSSLISPSATFAHLYYKTVLNLLLGLRLPLCLLLLLLPVTLCQAIHVDKRFLLPSSPFLLPLCKLDVRVLFFGGHCVVRQILECRGGAWADHAQVFDRSISNVVCQDDDWTH